MTLHVSENVRENLKKSYQKEYQPNACISFIDDCKVNEEIIKEVAMRSNRGVMAGVVRPDPFPAVTWETPVLEITQHPLFPETLHRAINQNVRGYRHNIVTEFGQLFGWGIHNVDKVIQEYYKIVLKQSKCSSRMRGYIERIINATCVTLINKYNDGKRPAQAETTAGKS